MFHLYNVIYTVYTQLYISLVILYTQITLHYIRHKLFEPLLRTKWDPIEFSLCCTLKSVLQWPDDDRLTVETRCHNVIWVYNITMLIYSCVWMEYITLYNFVTTLRDGLCQMFHLTCSIRFFQFRWLSILNQKKLYWLLFIHTFLYNQYVIENVMKSLLWISLYLLYLNLEPTY